MNRLKGTKQIKFAPGFTREKDVSDKISWGVVK